jgi:hyperosmotically inducible periplasmic protein
MQFAQVSDAAICNCPESQHEINGKSLNRIFISRWHTTWKACGAYQRQGELFMKHQLSAIALGVALVCGGAASSFAATNTDMSAKSSQQPVTDTWITTKVKSELATTEGIKSGDISVTTKNGLVTLSGTVNSKAQMQKAVAVAKAVKGVHDVDSSALSSRD